MKNLNKTKFENMLNFKYFQDFFLVMTETVNQANTLIQPNYSNNVLLNDFTKLNCFLLRIFSQSFHINVILLSIYLDLVHDLDNILHNWLSAPS